MKFDEKLLETAMKIYFAHPYKLFKTEIEGVFIDVIESLGYEVLNPFDGESKINNQFEASDFYQFAASKGIGDESTQMFSDAIVKKDIALISECDAVIAYLDNKISQTGTIFEIIFALKSNKKVFIYSKQSPSPFILSLGYLSKCLEIKNNHIIEIFMVEEELFESLKLYLQ